jgi:hypothetical protein
MLLKGSRTSEGFLSLLQYSISLQCDILHVCFGNGNERIYSHICCFSKVCHRLNYYICLMVNRMNTDRFIMLTPIDFLSSVWTFMFEVMEMSEDFPHFFLNPVRLHF